MLAFTLRQLAVGLSAGDTLTFARYRELGGVRGALTRHADAALAAAVQTSGLTEHDVLAGLTRLVTVDDNGRHARRSIKLAGLPGQLRLALQVLVDLRLLLSDTDNAGEVWLAVVHEALLTEWRPLHAAIMQVTVALRAARTVEQAAAEWYSAGQSEHYLWDEERLAATVKILGMTNDGGGLDIVTPPIVDVDNEALAFLEATAQRVEATKARERRRRNRTSTVLAVLLVLALIAGSLAIWQQQMARSAQYAAIASGMTAQADRVRDRDPRAPFNSALPQRILTVVHKAGQASGNPLPRPPVSELSGRTPARCRPSLMPRMDAPWPPPARTDPSHGGTWEIVTIPSSR